MSSPTKEEYVNGPAALDGRAITIRGAGNEDQPVSLAIDTLGFRLYVEAVTHPVLFLNISPPNSGTSTTTTIRPPNNNEFYYPDDNGHPEYKHVLIHNF
jgi:hypothetical protein